MKLILEKWQKFIKESSDTPDSQAVFDAYASGFTNMNQRQYAAMERRYGRDLKKVGLDFEDYRRFSQIFMEKRDKYIPIEKFIENTVRQVAVPKDADISRVLPWGNYFDRKNFYYHRYHHVPHVDFPGWVGNLWLSEHPEGSRGTQFYNYKDNWKHDRFDFPRPEKLLGEWESSWHQWEISEVESYMNKT